MACPLTPDWLKTRKKGARKIPIPSKVPIDSSEKVCPVHKSFNHYEEHTVRVSGKSCCLSGCCSTKSHSKATDILAKLLEKSFGYTEEDRPPNVKDKDETWCQRRAKYRYKQDLIFETTQHQVLEKMGKSNLETLLSAVNENQIIGCQVTKYIGDYATFNHQNDSMIQMPLILMGIFI